MKYVLVRLIGDEATRSAASFGDALARIHQPHAAWEELNPPVDDVARAVAEVGKLVVIGHDGPLGGRHSLRATAQGSVWLDGTQLGQRFRGARIYLWACETLGVDSVRDPGVAYLGDEAVHAGAASVAGYSYRVHGALSRYAHVDAPWLLEVLRVLVFDFLEGGDWESDLRDEARRAIPRQLEFDARAALPLEISLVPEGQGDSGWFGREEAIHDLINHLHISTRRREEAVR